MSKKMKLILFIDAILLIFVAFYRYIDADLGANVRYFDSLGFIFQSVVHLGIISYWGITVYQRVMQNSIRNYLLAFCVLGVTWFSLRNIKWRAFEYLSFESRFMWYLFYIPMLFIPLCGFFIALSMGKDENFKLNIKWHILYVVAAFLVVLVLTNDLHQLVFVFQANFENWDYDYKYGAIYFIIQLFMWSIILSAVFTLFKKWRKINRTKNSYLPLLVILVGVIYIVSYILDIPLVNLFMDITTFNVLFYILFWESCIQVGLIRSNTKHKEFFKNSKVDALILDKKGKANLISSWVAPITENEFIALKENTSIIAENTVSYIAPITSGHVVWKKDISKLNDMKQELTDLQDELYGEVAFLEEERKLKEQHARVQKLNDLYDLISTEIFPQVDKIETLIKKDQIQNKMSQDIVLKHITLTSCYIKRKTNLLLQIDSGKQITNADMINCYNESFRGLGLFGIGCDIKYNPPINTSAQLHILCYDLFEAVLEKTNFELELVFVNCMEDEKNLRFSIQILRNNNISENSFNDFKQAKLEKLSGVLEMYEDDENVGIKILFPKKGGRGC